MTERILFILLLQVVMGNTLAQDREFMVLFNKTDTLNTKVLNSKILKTLPIISSNLATKYLFNGDSSKNYYLDTLIEMDTQKERIHKTKYKLKAFSVINFKGDNVFVIFKGAQIWLYLIKPNKLSDALLAGDRIGEDELINYRASKITKQEIKLCNYILKNDNGKIATIVDESIYSINEGKFVKTKGSRFTTKLWPSDFLNGKTNAKEIDPFYK